MSKISKGIGLFTLVLGGYILGSSPPYATLEKQRNSFALHLPQHIAAQDQREGISTPDLNSFLKLIDINRGKFLNDLHSLQKTTNPPLPLTERIVTQTLLRTNPLYTNGLQKALTHYENLAIQSYLGK